MKLVTGAIRPMARGSNQREKPDRPAPFVVAAVMSSAPA
jgi:hypothetical protein